MHGHLKLGIIVRRNPYDYSSFEVCGCLPLGEVISVIVFTNLNTRCTVLNYVENKASSIFSFFFSIIRISRG